jgi:acetoacetate decarboxylase
MKTLISTLFLLLFFCSLAKSQPYTYKGSEFVSIVFQTSPDLVNKLVPKPLIANKEGLMSIAIGLQRMESGFTYHEMYLAIPVEFNGKKGAFIPLLYLNKVNPIILGREIWGFPKYDAEINFQKDDKKATASIYKDGKLLIEAYLELGNVISNIKGSDDLLFVLKYIPSVEEGSIDVKKLNSVFMTNNTYTKYQEATAKLIINNIPDAFIGELPIIRVLNASYHESNFLLGFGKTEYDYLKQK